MEESHSSKKRLFAVAFAALAVVGVAVVIIKLRSVDSEAAEVAGNIETQLNDLDPVTRAAALKKLGEDGV